MAHDTQLLKGTVKLLALRLLELGPMYGYQMLQHLQERSEGYFEVGEGALYPLLHELEEAGFLKAEWRVVEDRPQRRRYYHLTAKGRRELARRRGEWRDFAKAMDLVLEARNARV
jgi:PadR family transcriptional regulator PadR